MHLLHFLFCVFFVGLALFDFVAHLEEVENGDFLENMVDELKFGHVSPLVVDLDQFIVIFGLSIVFFTQGFKLFKVLLDRLRFCHSSIVLSRRSSISERGTSIENRCVPLHEGTFSQNLVSFTLNAFIILIFFTKTEVCLLFVNVGFD